MVHHHMSKYQWCLQIWIFRLEHHCHYAFKSKETYKISNCEYVKTLLAPLVTLSTIEISYLGAYWFVGTYHIIN